MVESSATLPSSIHRLIELGVRVLNPSKVVLFGSRARGDAWPSSDYDLAFVFSEQERGAWARFLAEVAEGSVTLLPTDLIDWNHAPARLRERIGREGITLYEKPIRE